MKKVLLKTNSIKLIVILFFVQLSGFSQNQLSVPFTNGFIGVKGSNSQQANTIKTYATLGIAKTFFMQNSTSASAFIVQGNDVPGTLRLQLNSGQLIDIPGAVVWKDGNAVNYLGFIPADSFSSVSFSYGAGLTYTIFGTTTTSNIGLGLVGKSTADFVDGANLSGNASSPAGDLNDYLTTTLANKPSGPVTVTALTTTDTTPTVMGTVTLISGESLSVDINNVFYNVPTIVIVGSAWSLPISSALALGTYSVVAKITNSAGYTLDDATTNELTIGAVVTKKFITRTGQQPDDISFHVNRYGEIGVSSLTSSGEEVFYVPKHSGAAVLVSSTETTANLTSTIATTGGKSIANRGICWSTTANPTTADNKTVDGNGKGSFNSAITGLTGGTTYYVRAYATNDLGTSYGTEMSFTTPISFPFLTITSTTGKIWMDRNLGATQVAQSEDDHLAYGDLYQWGRLADGHEKINWTGATAGAPVNGITTTRLNQDVPGNNLFVTGNSDWRATPNDNLWQGEAGINNPCPSGYRVPTSAEITAELIPNGISSRASAFASIFKFTASGSRTENSGTLNNVGSVGYYWTSSQANSQFFLSSSVELRSDRARSEGFSVRCIKN